MMISRQPLVGSRHLAVAAKGRPEHGECQFTVLTGSLLAVCHPSHGALCLLPAAYCFLPTSFQTRGPSGGRGGRVASTNFKTPIATRSTGQVLCNPQPGTT